MRGRCEAATQRDTCKQIGIDPEIEFRLALAAGGAGKVEHGIGAEEKAGLRGNEGAEIALDPFCAVWPGRLVGDQMIDEDKPLDHFIPAVEPHGTAYRHGRGKPAAEKSVSAGDQNICHGGEGLFHIADQLFHGRPASRRQQGL